MTKIESFRFSIDEHAGQLTEQTHQTIYWLFRHGYLNEATTNDLLSRMVVVPIRNHKWFGRRILERYFGVEDDSNENSFVFPITLLERSIPLDTAPPEPKKGKPKLKVVE
jgi:hypothetical protein